MASKNFFAVIAGVGGGTGRSVSLKFAKSYPVVLLSRTPGSYSDIVDEIKKSGGEAIGISTDVSDTSSVKSAFEAIKKEFGGKKLAAAVYNASGRPKTGPFLSLTIEDWEDSLKPNLNGLFNFAQSTIPLLLEAVDDSPHPPSLVITGATASLRGSAKFSTFATSKFGVRALGQSLAREFGPQGVHVAHAIIDGVIDIPRTKDYHPNNGVEGGKLDPDAIADSYWYLHTQPRSAFTQELDLRPFVEKF